MMRAIIILVMLNIMILAYFQISAAQVPEGHQPLPDLHPEQIQVLSDKELAELPVLASTPQNAGAKQ